MNATPLPALAAFRAALIADPAAARHLAEPIQFELFADRACAWAETQGITLTAAILSDAVHAADPIGVDQVPPPGWLPVRVPDGTLDIEWLHFAGIPPQRPFFEDSMREARARPLNRLLRPRTSIDTLIAAPRDPGFAPAGFVFHMSRCGSTLVAQMLGAAPGHVVLAEPPPFDALIRAEFTDPERQAKALRALLHAYGRDAERLFVKLDSWHTHALPLLRRVFPDVPWIFLHRDPVEVLVSHRRMRGMHTVPGLLPPAWLGLSPEDAGLPETAFIAKVLAGICAAVVPYADAGLVIDYDELPEAFFNRILPHFGIAPDAAARAAMEAAALRNAKAPEDSFRADRDTKQNEADTELRAAATPVRTALAALGPSRV